MYSKPQADIISTSRMKNILTIVAGIFLVIFAYLLVTNLFLAFQLPPSGGDSYWYHVPIAKNILSGNIFFQKGIIEIEQWYPGASECFTAILILLHLPVNLLNVVGIFIFSLVLYKLGKKYVKGTALSIIYSLSVVISYGVFRLVLSQNIDIWMVMYFLALVMLFEDPKSTNKYWLLTGFFSGMLVGSKYAGPFYFIALLIVYGKILLQKLNPNRFLIFLIPFSLFGLFWYIRNLILTGSPVYPQSILFFKGLAGWHSYLTIPLWGAILHTPNLMLNAFVSELMLWPGLFLLIPLFFIYLKIRKQKYALMPQFKRIVLVAVLILIIYIFLPYDKLYLGMILSVRYIYNVFALLALAVFMIARYFKKEEVLAVALLSSALIIFHQPYQPKLVYLYVPIVVIIFAVFFYRKQILKIITKHLPL